MLEVKNVINFSKNDLKDVYVDDNLLITVGRDEKVYISDLKNNNSITHLSPNSGAVNSVTYKEGNVICGCQNGYITIYNLETNLRSNLYGHSSNVCTLEVRNNTLLSGSWDHTLKVWDLQELKMVDTIEHPGTVWCVKFIDDETFVTGCADKVIRIFHKNNLVSSHNLHNFCIRGITVIDQLIYSIDNEGTLLKMTVEGKLLAHLSFKDFMFSVCKIGEELVCCGENGKIYLLDLNLRVLDETTAPCVSCWKSYSFDESLYICGSDGSLYVFGINNSDTTINNSDFYKKEEKKQDDQSNVTREFVSDNERFKVIGNDVYQLIDGDWQLLGEKHGETEHFDYSFKVELENKYYTLSFNKDSNIYQVADEFLFKNKLSDMYRDQIVDFIRSNYGSKGDYKLYDTINVEGVHKILGSYDSLPFIFSNLKTPNKKYEKSIEKELNLILKVGPRFVALDLFRYFTVHGLSFDLSFIFKFHCNDRKEALAFVRLLTVLYADLPFNIESLYPVVQRLRDEGLLKREELDDYQHNRNLNK